MERLADLVRQLHDAFRSAGIPHAFGGALALAYGVEMPRGTADIDVNVFLAGTEATRVFAELPEAVTWTDQDVDDVRRDGQVRLAWGRTPLDLFFNTAAFHEHVAANARTVPFEDGTIPVLLPGDLAVFKAFFNRPQDWVDIESMLRAESLDVAYVLDWLGRLVGDDDERSTRLRVLADDVASQPPGDRPFPRLPDV